MGGCNGGGTIRRDVRGGTIEEDGGTDGTDGTGGTFVGVGGFGGTGEGDIEGEGESRIVGREGVANNVARPVIGNKCFIDSDAEGISIIS